LIDWLIDGELIVNYSNLLMCKSKDLTFILDKNVKSICITGNLDFITFNFNYEYPVLSYLKIETYAKINFQQIYM
jgi:hypothetical protein